MNCYYCEEPPSNKKSHKVYKDVFLSYSGIDRVNSEKGYEEGNVRPCCFDCNSMKSNLTEAEFRAHIERMYLHLVKTGRIKEDTQELSACNSPQN